MDTQSTFVGVGGALLGMIVTKLISRTATNVDGLDKLYWRVEELEKRSTESVKQRETLERENAALWRELAKAKSWIEVASELARGKGLELTTPRWGKEP